ncbi:Yip1 family protein [Halobium palmae]|uniref:Yip1 family protein n=1 Tax=Halobium palmae TaxID=1776492 RepID=A0ABD5S473_9EURY
MVLDLLTNPDDFFERRAADPGYLRPALIVLAAAVFGAVSSVPVMQATLGAIPETAGGLATAFQAIGVIAGLVGAFVRWILYAAAFYAIAKVAFDGDGGFGATFALTGWGFVPAILGGALSAVAYFYAAGTLQSPQTPQQIAIYTRQLQSHPAVLAVGLLSIVILLWSAFLWTFAVKHVQNLSMRSAAITVAVPTALGVLLGLWGVLGGVL